MDHIGGFFDKYIRRDKTRTHARALISAVCEDILHHPILPEQITIRSGVISLQVPSVLKQEVFLKKNILLEALHKHPETKSVSDIR